MQLTPSTGLIIYILTQTRGCVGYFRSRARASYPNKATGVENLHPSVGILQLCEADRTFQGKGGFPVNPVYRDWLLS